MFGRSEGWEEIFFNPISCYLKERLGHWRFKCLSYKASCGALAFRVLVVSSLSSPAPTLAVLDFRGKTDLYLLYCGGEWH